MKNYRVLIPIAMIALLLLSWYSLIKNTKEELHPEYEIYLEEARERAELGMVKYAAMYYNAALDIKKTSDIYVEIAEMYKNEGYIREYKEWCEMLFDEYPDDAYSYEKLLEAYLTAGDYDGCYDILSTAELRGVSTDYLIQVAEDIKNLYGFTSSLYEDVSVFGNNVAPAKVNGLWGYVARNGSRYIDCKFAEVGVFTQTGLAPVIDENGDAYFIDMEGDKALATKDEYKRFGVYCNGMFAAEKPDGKFVYLNEEFEELIGSYDYATTFYNDIAAVKDAGKWKLIKTDGAELTADRYTDVKTDEKQISFMYERAFVAREDGKYIMIDTAGNQVGTLCFEDAMVFASEGPTAVKIDGKWCFVNTDGELVSVKKYDGARPYSNGMAAVCIGDRWGFVDEEETIVIEPEFYDAKDFTGKGTCFVKSGEDWSMISLYRLNRE